MIRDRDTTRVIREAVRSLREDLGLPRGEFKFSKCHDKIKDRFFTEISTLEFGFHTFTLNKRELGPGALDSHKAMYQKVTKWTVENVFKEWLSAPTVPPRGSLVFDACADRSFYDGIDNTVQRLIETWYGNKIRFSTTAVRSTDEPLLQLADMVCGAVSGHYKGDARSSGFVSLLKKTRRGECRFWPP